MNPIMSLLLPVAEHVLDAAVEKIAVLSPEEALALATKINAKVGGNIKVEEIGIEAIVAAAKEAAQILKL
jgi:hypothetical protein